jgi:putative oxidoreductase
MTDQTLASANEAASLQRLADSLRRLVPPPAAAPLVKPVPAKPSPAVSAALARAATTASRAAGVRGIGSRFGVIVEMLAMACAVIPYAVVALALRLVIARAFLLDGQFRIEGVRVPIAISDFSFALLLPLDIKAETFATFADLYTALPVPTPLIAAVVSLGEFILPMMLILGFGTRFAALGLLAFTALIYYAQPAELWTNYVYWAAILMVLIARGAGAISLDQLLRYRA